MHTLDTQIQFLSLWYQHLLSYTHRARWQALSRNWRKSSHREDERDAFQMFLWRFLQGKPPLFSVFRISMAPTSEDNVIMPVCPAHVGGLSPVPSTTLHSSLFPLCRFGGSLKEVSWIHLMEEECWSSNIHHFHSNNSVRMQEVVGENSNLLSRTGCLTFARLHQVLPQGTEVPHSP